MPLAGASGGRHCELLLRWQTASGDILAPGAFLPAAEQAGLSLSKAATRTTSVEPR
ncbi:hypothetical protein [Halomonas sp. 18071143]